MTAAVSPARGRTGSRAASSHLTGTGAMVRLALRRDRIKLPIWVLATTVLVPRFYYAATTTVVPTPEALAEATRLIRVSFMKVLAGPFFGVEAVTTQKYFLAAYWVEFLLAAALMNMLLITRHTRAEEQTGRAELIRAAVIGRHAQLTAALIVALLGNAVLAAFTAVAAISIGFPTGSALLFGASLAAAGLVFAAVTAVTAVTAQLTEYTRSASGLAGVALFGAWILRGAGAMQTQEGGPLFWLSPIGWSQQARVLAGDRWWPLGLSALLAGLLVAGAYALAGRRDLGAALVAPRPGRPSAPSWLRSPFTLALRLQQAAIGWWGAAFVAVGLVLGGMTGGMSNTDLPIFAGADFGRAWLSLMVFTGSLYTGVFAVLSILRLRAEEVRGRIGPVLAGPTSRSTWLGSSLLVSALAVAVLLAVYGFALGAGAAASSGDLALAGEVIRACLLRIPEVLVLLAVPAALLGLAPRAISAAWVVLVYSGFVQILGSYQGVPGWLVNTSVLSHLPWHPLGAFAPVATVVLVALAGALTALGLYGLRRRDLTTV
ncbi:ABC transporter permease [Streptosporangium sp. CA-135522]|uniref:ABC transporter permease n=1 Tax=Streptosporangium sp. CA-135522 TaxID=3240072 RepID=UPI003D93B1B3